MGCSSALSAPGLAFLRNLRLNLLSQICLPRIPPARNVPPMSSNPAPADSRLSPRIPLRFLSLLSRAALLVAGLVLGSEVVAAEPAAKLLVFRNIPSWDRNPDFEDSLRTLKIPFDVQTSARMKETRLSDYRVILIPGAQWETTFYSDFARAADAFDRYVQEGGVLLLELNGAERDGITLPGGPTMVPHEGFDNLIVLRGHPALAPLAQKPRITANLASHGYLDRVPSSALVLMTVMKEGGAADTTKPTYVEYVHGKGRIIAACQCFHDQDESGRGPLMPAALTYAMAGKWYSPK